MPIYDVMLQAAPSDMRLLRVLCDCFEDKSDNASFLQASIEAPDKRPDSLITVDRWPLTGDFALYASVATPMKTELGDVAAFLAKSLETQVLYSAGDDDPRKFVLVEPNGHAHPTTIAEVDDAREIRLVSASDA